MKEKRTQADSRSEDCGVSHNINVIMRSSAHNPCYASGYGKVFRKNGILHRYHYFQEEEE